MESLHRSSSRRAYTPLAVLVILALFALLSLLAPAAQRLNPPTLPLPVEPSERVRLAGLGGMPYLSVIQSVGITPFLFSPPPRGSTPAPNPRIVYTWLVGPANTGGVRYRTPSLIRSEGSNLCLCAGVHNGTFLPEENDAVALSPCPDLSVQDGRGCLWERTDRREDLLRRTLFVLHTAPRLTPYQQTLVMEPCMGYGCEPLTLLSAFDVEFWAADRGGYWIGWEVVPEAEEGGD